MLSEARIDEIIRDEGVFLLGEIPVTDEEYKELLDYSRIFVRNVSPAMGVRINLRLSLAMVQIAIREYKEGKYWGYFCDAIDEELSTAKTNYCGKVFAATVKKYGLFYVDRESGSSQMYVENIKIHSIVTNFYMDGFWEFLFSYYEKNLFRQITDDLIEDVELLSRFMRQTLNSNSDSIVGEETGGKAAKSYKLLKSTRTLLGYGDSEKILLVLSPALEMIDKYYYDSELPDNADRYSSSFSLWCKERESRDKTAVRKTRTRGLISKRPYIHLDINSMVSFLCIPAQKFRDDDFDGEAGISVTIDGHRRSYDLEVYRSFGIYISEEKRIPIPSLFDSVDVSVESNKTKVYKIKGSDYRVINDSFNSINKCTQGKNTLLVKKGIKVTFDNEEDCVDYSDEYALFDFYSVSLNEESIIHVGNTIISIAGEYLEEPYFEEEVQNYEVIDAEGEQLKVARTHPTVSFIVEKNRLAGTVMIVNGIKCPVVKLINKTICSTVYAGCVAVVVTLEEELPKRDGLFDVVLDVPGKIPVKLIKYVRVEKLDVECNKRIFASTDTMYINVFNGHDNVWPIRDDLELVGMETGVDTYTGPINEGDDYVEFNLELNEVLTVKVPIYLFKAGFSPKEILFKQSDYIWYSDLQETVYCSAPGTDRIRVYLNHDRDNYVNGISLGGGLFRVDISPIKEQICLSTKEGWAYINVTCFGSGKRSFLLFSILRVLWVDPYFDFVKKEGKLCFDLTVHGNARLLVNIEDDISKEKIITDREIVSGTTYLPELDLNGQYNIFPRMEEGDDFGFNTEVTTMRTIFKQSYVGMDNLSDYRLQIGDLEYCGERQSLSYDYFIDVRQKVNGNTYQGTMFGLKLLPRTRGPERTRGRYELGADNKPKKKRFGNVRIELISEDEKAILIKLWSSTYDEDGDEWIELYYDTAYKTLLHCNDNVLSKASDYERFVFLAEEDTYFRVMKKKIRRLVIS